MKLSPPRTLQELSELIGKEYVGKEDHLISGLNEIHQVEAGDLVFVDHPKYYDKVLHSAANTILIDQKVDPPPGKALIISDDPFRDYNQLTRHFAPFHPWKGERGENVTIAPSAVIHPGVIIGNNVSIGEGSVLHAGVVLGDNTTLGENVIIQANSTIGSDAFYYKKRPEGYEKLHSCGSTVIGDDVEMGALCSVDKGVSGATVIGRGTKMDNQVHIGHDTVIGEHCLFAAQVGISGCVRIHDRVTLWGQVGVVADLTLGEGTVVLGQAGVTKDLDPGKTYISSPAREARQRFREMSALQKLPDIIEKL